MIDRHKSTPAPPIPLTTKPARNTDTIVEAISARSESNNLLNAEQLWLLLDAVPSLISYVDKDLRYQFANAAYERWLGVSPSSLVGKQITEVLGKSTFTQLRTYIDRALAGESQEFETELTRPEGKQYIRAQYIPDHDKTGNVRGYIAILNDITERKEAEEYTGKLAAIVESSDDAIISKTLDGIITSWNSSAERIFGYSAQEMISESITKLIPADRLGEETMITQKLRQGERVEHFRTKRLTKSGSLLDVSLTISPIRDRSGNIIGASKIARDISKQQLVETALRESEKRFRAIADTAPVMIWMSGTDKLHHFFNTSWLEFRGRSIEQEVDNGWTEGVHPDDLQNCLNTYRTSFEARAEFEMEYRLQRHDGEYRWITVHGVPRFAPHGVFIGYIGSCIDITDRKMASQELERQVAGRTVELRAKNEQLQQQKEFVDAILDTSVDTIVVIGKQLEFLAVNDKAAEAWGKSKEDLLDKRITDIFPQLEGAPSLEIIKKTLEGKGDHLVTYPSHINGRHYENFFIPLRDNNNEVYACLSIGHDNTPLMSLTEKLKETNDILAEKNKQLSRSNSDLEQFAYIASHDLQEPLRKIRMFSDRLLNTGGVEGPSHVYLEKIMSASERMSDLINDLLNYSRLSYPEEGFTKTDLNKILHKVVSDFDAIIAEKNASVIVEKMPKVDAIPLQMNQLFHNLVSNSLKFTREGVAPHIRITSRLLSKHEMEEQRLFDSKGYIMVTVEDNGIGFEQAYAEKIFVIFQRLNGRQEYKGTGIGLAICKKIVDTHKGKIFAESQEGGGTSFHVILPVEQKAE